MRLAIMRFSIAGRPMARMLFFFLGILCALGTFTTTPLWANERLIHLADFQAFSPSAGPSKAGAPGSEKNAEIVARVRNRLKADLENLGFRVTIVKDANRARALTAAKTANAYLYIGGYFTRHSDGGLNLYGQIYDPRDGFVIDAYNRIDRFREMKDLKFPADERSDIATTLRKFSARLMLGIRANPNRRERKNNILEFLTQTELGKSVDFPIRKTSIKKDAADVFKLLGEIQVVSAARRGQKISEAPSNIVVVTSDMIRRRGYLTLTEVLQDVPYFDFTTFYDGGEFPTNFLMRGLTDVGNTKVLIMEDGIVQNDVNLGWSRNLSYNTAMVDIERIEIVLGPGSALYGANAYAGLINIITKKPGEHYKGKKKTGLHLDTGLLYSRNTQKRESGPLAHSQYGGLTREKEINETWAGEGLAAYRWANGLTLRLAARWYKSDGDDGLGRPDPGNFFHNNREPVFVQTTQYPAVENDVFLGATKRLRDGFRTDKRSLFLRGRAQWGSFTLGFNFWERRDGMGSYVPGYEYFTAEEDKFYEANHKGAGITATHDARFNRKFSLKSRLYYRTSIIAQDTGFIYTYRFQSLENPRLDGRALPPVPDFCKCYNATGKLIGLEEQFNYSITPTNELIFGFQLESLQREFLGISFGREPEPGTNTVQSTFTDNGPFFQLSRTQVFHTTNSAVFIQDEQKFLKHYAFTGGIRYDIISDTDGIDRIRIDGRGVATGILNPRMGLTGNPWKGFNFKLLYGEAFKSPTLFELFDEFRGNPNLKPQRIQTWEALATYRLGKYVILEAGYFFSLLQDVIEIRPNDGTIPIGSASQFETFSQNVEATHMFGGSASIKIRAGRNFYFYVDYNVTADRDPKTPLSIQTDITTGRITSIDLLEDGHEIDNIAMRKANFGVNGEVGPLNINLRMNWVGKRKAPATNRYFQPYDFDFIQNNYPYEIEGDPDGYMAGYTIWHLTLTWRDLLGVKGLSPQLIIRNLLDTPYAGIGRQAASGTRPRSDFQPLNGNPPGFIPPYHPQAGREIILKVNFKY